MRSRDTVRIAVLRSASRPRLPALTRNERLVLAAITATGIALRAERLGELSLAHFDEGVLMSGAFDVRLKGLWQFTLAQPLQAPPLYPWLVSGLMWLTGFASPLMGVYTSALFGSATVPLFFMLARRWGGNRAGLVAAGMMAASDLHIAFSRMALTEAAVTFWFVLAMYALARLSDAAGPSLAARHIWVWAAAAGLAAGAAWNTKYNGWMPLAIVATAWILVIMRRWFFERRGGLQMSNAIRNGRLWSALLLAAAVATACYVPWYRFVERSFPGGYAAVTQNHMNYVSGLNDWPHRASRLFVSLSAFRHGGWLLMLAAMLLAPVWHWIAIRQTRLSRHSSGRVPAVASVLGALGVAAAVAVGVDAMCFLVATAAIAPALIWGRLEQIVLAVWVGAFVVLTPFYHPYTRLLVPAIPGAIGLTVWLLSVVCRGRLPRTHDARDAAVATDVEPSPKLAKAAGFGVAASIVAGLAVAFVAHPFGWLPTPALWHRWSTRQSYRAFNDAVREHTPTNAHLLCQGMPIMPLYIERRWDSLGHVPFTAWIGHVPAEQPCYLAVDFWGIYGEHHEAARQALAEHLDSLQLVAWVENDLNVVTLLDYLPAAEVARRISHEWPARQWTDRTGRSAIVPAEPRDDHANLIVLYRIDRKRIQD